MNVLYIIVIAVGAGFLAFQLIQIISKKGGGHRPGQ